MTQDLQGIGRYVSSLVWRERTLILIRIALQGAFLGIAVLFLAVLAAVAAWERSTAVAAVVLLAGGGAWFGIGFPLLTRWKRAGDPRRQARLVETVEPELRGRLLTAVDRIDGPQGQESPAMLGLIARRALGIARAVRPSKIHPATHLLLLILATGAFAIFTTGATLLVPGGPGGIARWWRNVGTAQAAVASAEVTTQEERARVGDLILRYVYPDYTGLEAMEVPNSTGDAHGPPGTVVEVVARSAETIEAASLVAYEEPALEAIVEDGRVISASFTIEPDPGFYAIVTYRAGTAIPSRDFAISPEPDLPPEVMLDSEEVLEVAADQFFELPWRARDDYGIRRVGVEIDGTENKQALTRLRERKAEVFGSNRFRPLDLGLVPGSRVKLTIVAWDNDTYSGTKPGRSQKIEIIVLGKSGLDQRADERQRKLRDAFLDVLADHLEEPFPPGQTSDAFADWGAVVSERYEPLQELEELFWQEIRSKSNDARALRSVLRTGRELIRYSQIAFTPDDVSTPPATALEVTGDLRDKAIMALEDGIILLDRALRNRALRDVAERAEQLARAAEQVEQMLATQEVDPLQLLSQLDQLERMMEELAKASEKLQEGGLKEYVNQRNSEMKSLSQEIREAVAEGDMEEAKMLMERLADQARQMQQGVQHNIEQMQQQGEELAQQGKDLAQELTKLEEEQRSLAERIRQAREAGDAETAEVAESLWEEVDAQAAQLQERGDNYARRLEESDRPFYEEQRAQQAAEDAGRLQNATDARDLRGAQRELIQARRHWDQVRRTLEQEMRRNESIAGPGDRELSQVERNLDELDHLLEQLDQTAGNVDPTTQRQVRTQRQEQEKLKQRLQEAQQAAKEFAQQFPVRPEGLEEGLHDAKQEMEQASAELGQGRPMPAEGSMGTAAQRIADAREALEQAMEKAAEQQQALGGGGSGGKEGEPQEGGEGEGEGGGDQSGESDAFDQPMEIPAPEDFRTPEEYRRALLEGMEGEVPEQYRALKKRYYEELVRQ